MFEHVPGRLRLFWPLVRQVVLGLKGRVFDLESQVTPYCITG